MVSIRNVSLAAMALGCLSAGALVHAGQLDSNNSPDKATVLIVGQKIVSGLLDATIGRPDTLLAQYDAGYHTVLRTDDNGSSMGNGKASRLVGVPLSDNGSAYFRITGSPDFGFRGSQTETGSYSVEFDIYDAAHQLLETQTRFESVAPGMVDNVWVKDSTDLRRVGGTVDVTVNNVVGQGNGNALDYFLFKGLAPNAPFVAKFDNVTFQSRMGQFNANDPHAIFSSELEGGIPVLRGIADALGQAIIGVTANSDPNFKGEHTVTGAYTLEVQIPEPSSVVLLGIGSASALVYRFRRKRRRR